jgi:hypothetical protein
MPRGLTRAKARKILHDGTVQGKSLTDKQRRFFGARASGQPMKFDRDNVRRALLRKPKRRR